MASERVGYIVYKYTSPSGKIYIGKTSMKRERRRKYEHMDDARKHRFPNVSFHKAIRKYGFENFKYEVLAYVSSNKTADLMETALIKQFDSKNKNIGYNLTDGGDGTYGRIVSEEARLKQSKSMTGKKQSEEHRKKLGEIRKKIYLGDNNPNSKDDTHWETKAVGRREFKDVCKRRDWDFDSFIEVHVDTYVSPKGKKLKKYNYFKRGDL